MPPCEDLHGGRVSRDGHVIDDAARIDDIIRIDVTADDKDMFPFHRRGRTRPWVTNSQAAALRLVKSLLFAIDDRTRHR